MLVSVFSLIGFAKGRRLIVLKYFSVVGLHGAKDIKIPFDDQLTVITGENGCGKTSALKLMWYLLSPNVERAYREVDFDEAFLETDRFSIRFSKHERVVEFESEDPGRTIVVRDECDDESKDVPVYLAPDESWYSRTKFEFDLETINRLIKKQHSSSLFFPTYRRIEESDSASSDDMRQLSRAIRDYSQKVSVDKHRLIASVSTKDIKELIVSKYAALSERALSLRGELLNGIVSTIADTKNGDSDDAKAALASIRRSILEAEEKQADLFSSFDKMKEMIANFIDDKAVRINNTICFGDTDRMVGADNLSAGEKQVLSFLAYNAFYQSAPLIIDEPELSLHIDWQRKLLPMLLSQETSNQIIVATHSPFIYSKYPDKEIRLSH